MITTIRKEVINQKKENTPGQLTGFAKLFSHIPTTLHAFLYCSVMGLLVLIWAIRVSRYGFWR